MIIAILLFFALAVIFVDKNASRRVRRPDKRDLEFYGRKARCEEAFPFDYLSR